MKKTLLGLFLGLSVMSMGEVTTGVGTGVDVSGDLKIIANVVAPLKIEEVQTMTFNNIIVGEAATSNLDGKMRVVGAAGNSVYITCPATATISREGVAGSDVIVNLTTSSNGKDQTLDKLGLYTDTITGTIAKGQTKYSGQHTGTVSISVRYN